MLILNYCISGRGVFAKCQIKKGDFVVEYRGKTITRSEKTILENKYEKEKLGSYLYQFRHQDKAQWFVLLICIKSLKVEIHADFSSYHFSYNFP